MELKKNLYQHHDLIFLVGMLKEQFLIILQELINHLLNINKKV